MNILRYSIFFLGFALLFSCKDEVKPKGSTIPQTKVKVPVFDGQGAYDFIQKQVDFGKRVPGTEAHKKCKDWLVKTLEGNGAKVTVQEFKASFLGVKDAESYNIIASFNPDKKKRVALAAHWDTRLIADKDDEKKDQPIDGADDGGSGVGVLLQLAKIIQENPIDLGVDIILFDAEDNGEDTDDGSQTLTWCLGSQYWRDNLHQKGYKAKYGILLDMVGAKGARFPLEGYSTQYAPGIQKKIWDLAGRMGYGDLFQNVQYRGGITDDHVYMNEAGIPTVDIINLPTNTFGTYHHTHDDNMSLIDANVLRRVGQIVTTVLYKESEGSF